MRKSTRAINPSCLLLALSVCCAWWPPPTQGLAAQPALPGPLLRFGQSLALSDFDGDGRPDLASLNHAGRQQSIEILLSRTGKRSVIQFDAGPIRRGSLFAQDVDNDGATDLVWTDLLHPDDVVIWLGDGTGRFKRICPHEYANRFVLPNFAVTAPADPTRNRVSGYPSNHSLDLLLEKRALPSIAGTLKSKLDHVQLRRGTRRQPCDRGPPNERSVCV